MDLGKALVGRVSRMGRRVRDGKVQEQRATFVQSQGMANDANMIIITNHKGERVRMDTDGFNSIPEEPHPI
jgi:hypothetical protein